MKTVLVLFLFCLAQVEHSNEADTLQLQATPQELIPGLTQTLQLLCGPGRSAHDYRQVFLIQLLTDVGGVQTPLATLLPDKAPTLGLSDPRLAVSGRLDSGSPSGASLLVTVRSPTDIDAGTVSCKVVGLGTNGNEVTHLDSIIVTVHPESNLVDAMLKKMVADLKTEADSLLAQTNTLRQENQRLLQLTTAREQALSQRRTHLEQLRSQVQSLQQTVADQEVTLTLTAQELVEEIANVTQDAPPMRLSFNAAERTERTYASGAQILLETVEVNEGQGYNVSSSTFQPPVAGVYYFTTAQLAHDTAAASTRVYSIRVNSTVVGSAYNGDDRQSSKFQHSSTSALVSLSPYDVVSVYQQYSATATTLLAPYSNTPNGLSTNFAGYLVY